jgi:hypothetical protein
VKKQGSIPCTEVDAEGLTNRFLTGIISAAENLTAVTISNADWKRKIN